MSGCQAPPVNALSARRRAAFEQSCTPLPLWDRADSGPLAAFSSLHSSGRPNGLSHLAPVGETHPEAKTRPDRETSASLRFRGVWFSPSAPEVGVVAAPPMALLLRASATARDTPQSGGRKRPPSHDVSRPSRRGPPRQRHADCGFPAEDSSLGTSNSKFEIRNLSLSSIKQNGFLALLGYPAVGELEDEVPPHPQRLELGLGEPGAEVFLEVLLGQGSEGGEDLA